MAPRSAPAIERRAGESLRLERRCGVLYGIHGEDAPDNDRNHRPRCQIGAACYRARPRRAEGPPDDQRGRRSHQAHRGAGAESLERTEGRFRSGEALILVRRPARHPRALLAGEWRSGVAQPGACRNRRKSEGRDAVRVARHRLGVVGRDEEETRGGQAASGRGPARPLVPGSRSRDLLTDHPDPAADFMRGCQSGFGYGAQGPRRLLPDCDGSSSANPDRYAGSGHSNDRGGKSGLSRSDSLLIDMKASASMPKRVTERMNEVVDAVGASSDPFSRAAARRVLERVEW